MKADFAVPQLTQAASAGCHAWWQMLQARFLSTHPLVVTILPTSNQYFNGVFSRKGKLTEDIKSYLSCITWYKLGSETSVLARRVTLTDSLLPHYDIIYREGALRTEVNSLRQSASRSFVPYREFVFQYGDLPMIIIQGQVNSSSSERVFLVLRNGKAIWLENQSSEAQAFLLRHMEYELELIAHIQALEKVLNGFGTIRKARGHK